MLSVEALCCSDYGIVYIIRFPSAFASLRNTASPVKWLGPCDSAEQELDTCRSNSIPKSPRCDSRSRVAPQRKNYVGVVEARGAPGSERCQAHATGDSAATQQRCRVNGRCRAHVGQHLLVSIRTQQRCRVNGCAFHEVGGLNSFQSAPGSAAG